MFSQIAQVFSSQGVVLPGTERVPVPGGSQAPRTPSQKKSDFGAVFDQASAKLSLSKQAQDKLAQPQDPAKDAAGAQGADGKPLTDDQKKQLDKLAQTDRKVRAHEAAHQAAAGGYAKGGASFEYAKGPDGKQYAVGGHVDIDASPVKGNPQATLQKAQVVQRAALAPADPSGQDRAVASDAARMASQAQAEIAKSQAQGKSGEDGNESGNGQGGDHDGGATDQAAGEAGQTEADQARTGAPSAALRAASRAYAGAQSRQIAFSAYA